MVRTACCGEHTSWSLIHMIDHPWVVTIREPGHLKDTHESQENVGQCSVNTPCFCFVLSRCALRDDWRKAPDFCVATVAHDRGEDMIGGKMCRSKKTKKTKGRASLWKTTRVTHHTHTHTQQRSNAVTVYCNAGRIKGVHKYINTNQFARANVYNGCVHVWHDVQCCSHWCQWVTCMFSFMSPYPRIELLLL